MYSILLYDCQLTLSIVADIVRDALYETVIIEIFGSNTLLSFGLISEIGSRYDALIKFFILFSNNFAIEGFLCK